MKLQCLLHRETWTVHLQGNLLLHPAGLKEQLFRYFLLRNSQGMIFLLVSVSLYVCVCLDHVIAFHLLYLFGF